MRGFWGNRNWPCGSGDEGEGVLPWRSGESGDEGEGVLPWRLGESGDEGEMGLAVESCRIVERGGCG